ncbi:zinc finger CCCH domain-containing protein 27 isoform X2 [Oryza brachyantha]|uniref:zinc finger CCCH domain-containing protein 27 isoform X2 n=1 Tax=Oryza brachyantha TaxID=4533 RepID=UPI001ADD0761|nr:zinc finger CCCH domain-containing protein 27 isoform X2 [Oryza brachyantha]
MIKESSSPAFDAEKIEVPSPKDENNSSNSEAATDNEDFEISDDDDDDRNHKHRKREARPQSFDENTEQSPGGLLKKRQKISGGADSHGEAQKDFLPKFKRRPGAGAHSRGPRVNQPFRSDSSSSVAPRPPMTRGRGRNGAPWTQHEPRFNTLDMIDFASQMASQGPPTHPNLFMGAALPGGGSAQNGSWGPYGFMPGMPNGMLDPIHPLGIQGPIQPAISPLIDLGMPRQRCRDFEERGFCLRGDMCPMEHGLNRIVVEDMQSLSQFNLPVAVPNTQGLGIQNEAGAAPVNTSSLGGSKGVPAKDIKSGVTNDVLKLNGTTTSAVSVSDADVYDPDQPLWNSEHPDASCAGFAHNDGVWNAESSGYEAVREQGNQVFAADSSQNSKSSVWGRIASKKQGPGKTANATSTSATGNKRNESYDEMTPSTVHVNPASAKDTNGQSNSRIFGDMGRQSNRASHKASRTLYVNGIPLESNRWEALLSHFQKFGQVIDIYIPSNSEKAFIQFSKREEAEAALKAPDAVMGNRFIKLWWANRDRIPDEGEGRIPAKSSHVTTPLANSVPPQPSSSNRGKENLQSATPRASSGSSAEASGHGTVPKMLSANSVKSVPPDSKRQESLELLEELRKKQEILAQKRDEFRRQLERLAKQGLATSAKQAEGGGKEVSNDVQSTTDSKSMNTRTEGHQDVAGTLQKRTSGELASSAHKPSATSAQKSAVAAKQTSPLLAPSQSRFKLDNRTTSFRILPPLPPEIADESVLKDHFMSFGELSSVVLEDTEAYNNDATLKPSLSCSACVTYTTRSSAEKAFIGGKSCKGHTLRFMWLTASPGSSNHSRFQKMSIPARTSSFSSQTQNMPSDSSIPVGKISSTVKSGTTKKPHSESMQTAATAKASVEIHKALSSSSSLSSNVECPSEDNDARNDTFRDSDVSQ